MNVYFANGYVLSRDFEDGRARIRATEIRQRSGRDIRDSVFAENAFAACKWFGDTSMPGLVLPVGCERFDDTSMPGLEDPELEAEFKRASRAATGRSDYEAGVWFTESQAYAVIIAARAGVVLLHEVIKAFIDLRDGRVSSTLGEPVTPPFSAKQSGYSTEFEALCRHCLMSESELPPNKTRSAVIEDVVSIFDEQRRARRPASGSQYLM